MAEYFVTTDVPTDQETGDVILDGPVPDDAGRGINYPLAGPFETEQEARDALPRITLPANALCGKELIEHRSLRD